MSMIDDLLGKEQNGDLKRRAEDRIDSFKTMQKWNRAFHKTMGIISLSLLNRREGKHSTSKADIPEKWIDISERG